MARLSTHEQLAKLAQGLDLRGKAEAVDLSVFAMTWLNGLATSSADAAHLVQKMREAYYQSIAPAAGSARSSEDDEDGHHTP